MYPLGSPDWLKLRPAPLSDEGTCTPHRGFSRWLPTSTGRIGTESQEKRKHIEPFVPRKMPAKLSGPTCSPSVTLAHHRACTQHLPAKRVV